MAYLEFGSDPIRSTSRTYAMRFARICLLRMRCGEEHLVTVTERDLIDMAKTKLQEEVLSSLSYSEIEYLREELISQIKRFAIEKIRGFDLNKTDRNILIKQILSEDLSDLIPTVH